VSKVLIVVDALKDWAPYYPSDQVVTFEDYLALNTPSSQRVRVINLCSDYSYLGQGYYCSLLAEARGHNVVPPSKVLNDVNTPLLYQLNVQDLFASLDRLYKNKEVPDSLQFKTYFGQAREPFMQELARVLFERFPCPVLSITLRHVDKHWLIEDLQLVNHNSLNEEEETAFSEALDAFSRNVWRLRKNRKKYRHDLAILVNPEEKMPPSDEAAIKLFVKAGKNLGINVELIHPDQIMRLAEYDGLFIRETTGIEHHTYRFAKRAEALGMVVIDDPTSILRCTNKIYLADLFNVKKVPAPKTLILNKNNPAQLEMAAAELGLPSVVKIPDGSFSRGMAKVNSLDELTEKTAPLFEESSLLLAQEFLYTDFDWRIGVLNNKALYACRYYMVKNHWQIYRHGKKAESRAQSGGFDTLPTFEVPRVVLEAALKATRLIGDGFYGVDVKESQGKAYVIEVNDNPSIDHGVEDKYLGNELYSLIMQEFLRRLEM